jgi:TolA-binding protein
MRMKLMQAAACVVLLAFAAPSAFGQRTTPDVSRMDAHVKSYQDAVRYYQSGQFELARTELKKFLDNVGQHAGANFLMGMTQAQLGELEESRKYFRDAVKYDPTMVSPKGWLGAVEAALGNSSAANAQKAELEKLKAACAGTCPKAAEIAQEIQRIDDNLAAAAQPPKTN